MESKLDILIPENITGKALDDLINKYKIDKQNDLWKDPAKLAEASKDAKAILVRNQTKIDKKVIDSAASLQIIGRAGVGYDNIDVDYASKKGIVVCYTPDGNTIATAELAIGLMLALARKITSGDKSTKAGNWDRQEHFGIEVYGKTLGIVGFGKIGKTVAVRAYSFGIKVIAYDKYYNGAELEGIVTQAKTLDELLEQSDVISVHLPSTKDTIGLFNKETYDKIKLGAYLINTSRGNVIVEEDLIRALESGRLKGAALDVRLKEPPDKSKLNEMNNVILTPHIGGFTRESQDKVIDSIAHDIDLVLSGQHAINFVNFSQPCVGIHSII